MKNRIDDRKKRILFGILAVLLSVCLILLVFRIVAILNVNYGRIDSDNDAYAYKNDGRPEYLVNGVWYAQKENIETFLMIGIDKYETAIRDADGYRNNQQADALFLLVIDRKNEQYRIIHINRDAMVNIRMLDLNGNPYNTFVGQLALSHTYGSGREDSCGNTVWSVSDYLLGLKIDHYISFSMDAVEILNDKIGGVTLTVADDMTMIDKALEKGRTVTLKGKQALTYVRERKDLADSTNMARMNRQRQYVEAFLEQARTAISKDNSLASKLVNSVSGYTVSDLTSQELLMFMDMLYNYKFMGIDTIEGEACQGEQFVEFYTDEEALEKLVLKTFYNKK